MPPHHKNTPIPQYHTPLAHHIYTRPCLAGRSWPKLATPTGRRRRLAARLQCAHLCFCSHLYARDIQQQQQQGHNWPQTTKEASWRLTAPAFSFADLLEAAGAVARQLTARKSLFALPLCATDQPAKIRCPSVKIYHLNSASVAGWPLANGAEHPRASAEGNAKMT